jgi:DNA-binding response OmpR family regulator
MNAKIHSESASQALRSAAGNLPLNVVQLDPSTARRDAHPKARILVIDDHFGETPSLRRLLREEGFWIDVMTGMNFPITAGMFEDYQAVIVDIMVPQSNGFDGLRNIRKNTQLPVLVLTARGGEEDRITGLRLGADDYVVKPCRPREVVARIRALLRRRSSF